MAKKRTAQPTQKTAPDTPKVQSRAFGKILVKMCCGEKNEWNFGSDSTPDAIEKGRFICKQNGFNFPHSVTLWEITPNIEE